jgi:hypothetical protein
MPARARAQEAELNGGATSAGTPSATSGTPSATSADTTGDVYFKHVPCGTYKVRRNGAAARATQLVALQHSASVATLRQG